MIMMFSGTTAPTGWVLCNDSAAAQAANAPDLRDKFVVGAGNNYAVGDSGGAATVTLTEAQMPEHNHGAANETDRVVKITGNTNGFPNLGGQFGNGTYQLSMNNTVGGGGNTDKGNSEAHENRPPYYALCYIMKI